jgi:hypothetical protein
VTACIFWLKNRQPDYWRQKDSAEAVTDDGLKELADAFRASPRE